MATVLLDANFLAILLHDGAAIPPDPNTKKPYERARERVEALVESLQNSSAKILIPTPALAEFLVLAHPESGKYVAELQNLYRAEIASFDEMAAIELAEIGAKTGKPNKKERGEQTWAKLKYDRQIVAIAISRSAKIIYSTDAGLRSLSERFDIKGLDLCDTPLPPPKQIPLSGSD